MNLSILIPWRDSGDPWRRMSFKRITERYQRLFPTAELVFGVDSKPVFNRSEARNNAFSKSTGDVLLLADADTYVPESQINEGISALNDGTAPWVIPYGEDRYYNLTLTETLRLLVTTSRTSEIPEPLNPQTWDHKITSWSGLVMLRRESYETVGGFDEEFIGWGYEDRAFQECMERSIGPLRRVPGFVLHFWHPVPEETRFGQPFITQNRERYEKYQQGLL